jgi:anti-sigma B factor antagonist
MPMLPNDPSHVAGPTVRLQLAGVLDVLTAPDELKRILVEGRQAGCVELDLGGVDFIDSSGISMLIEARNEFDNVDCALVVVNPSKAVLRLLVLTGLTQAFGIIDVPMESSEG